MSLRKLPYLAMIAWLSMSGLTPVDAQPAAVPAVDGFWLGALEGPKQALRVQITVTSDSAGHEVCTLDSLDQRAFGLRAVAAAGDHRTTRSQGHCRVTEPTAEIAIHGRE